MIGKILKILSSRKPSPKELKKYLLEVKMIVLNGSIGYMVDVFVSSTQVAP